LAAIAEVGKEISKVKSTAAAEKTQVVRKDAYSKVSEIGWDVAASKEVPIV
jgi:hypothetical protein